jgi:enoyl-CoA hydratase
MTVVTYRVERRIATVTLDSPANRNALSGQLVGELSEHLDAAGADAGVRAVVLTHTGSTFCAGADLKESAAETGPAKPAMRTLELLRRIVELSKPVIARIDGSVRAGGVGLVGACDIALAGSSSSFGFTEVRLGLAPAIISLTTLPRLHDRAASRYYLTGETFGAATAERIGLITEATPDLDGAVEALLESLRGCSPQGLAETKPLTTQRVRLAFEEQAEAVQAQSARLFGSDDAREGILSFLQKRPPKWAIE